MIRRPTRSTRTYTLLPDSTLFRSGGWGAARIVDMVLPRLNRAAHGKSYMGYSDAGTLLAALYARGIGRQFHGPMPVDIVREGGEAAVVRALRSEERRVGNECVSRCRSGWSREH